MPLTCFNNQEGIHALGFCPKDKLERQRRHQDLREYLHTRLANGAEVPLSTLCQEQDMKPQVMRMYLNKHAQSYVVFSPTTRAPSSKILVWLRPTPPVSRG